MDSWSTYAEITDTGTGVLVVTYGYDSAGLTGIDAETGEQLWTHSGWTAVAGASGNIYRIHARLRRRATRSTLLISQQTVNGGGFCHPTSCGQAYASAWSAQAEQLFNCSLSRIGEAAIEGASLFFGSLVVGRRTFLTYMCTNRRWLGHVDPPVAIEVAYRKGTRNSVGAEI